MSVKNYLEQYKHLQVRVTGYRERVAQIEDTLKGVELDGMPRGTKIGDPTKNAAIRLTLLKEQLSLAIVEAEEKRQEIAGNIDKMKTPVYQELLFDRYLLFKTWPEVTDALTKYRPKGYEVKHVTGYMHYQALKELGGILNGNQTR